MATGARMRCEMSQNATSELPQAAPRPPAHDRRQQHQDRQPGDDREDGRHAQPRRDERADDHADAEHDHAHPRPVAEPDQAIRRERADAHREDGADGRHDHRVVVGTGRVVAQGDQHVVPVVEGRLEVDARDVERPLRDLGGRLERRDGQPVQREQDHDGPRDERDVAQDLGPRRQVERRALGEEPAHSTASAPYAWVRLMTVVT